MFLDRVLVTIPKNKPTIELANDLELIGTYVDNIWLWNRTKINQPLEYSLNTLEHTNSIYLKFYNGKICTTTNIDTNSAFFSWEKFLIF